MLTKRKRSLLLKNSIVISIVQTYSVKSHILVKLNSSLSLCPNSIHEWIHMHMHSFHSTSQIMNNLERHTNPNSRCSSWVVVECNSLVNRSYMFSYFLSESQIMC